MRASPKPDFVHYLPYFRERTEKIKYIIIHCSTSAPEKQLITLDKLQLSAHYIIGKNGLLTQALELDKVGYHAGISSWYDHPDKSLNGASIGIEIECPTMGQTKKSYSPKAIERLCSLLDYLVKKYHIKQENILGHSDIAPTRKPDPGAYFPWKKLYQRGFTFWYDERKLAREIDEISLLKRIGYDTTVLSATRYAFCRRWLKEEVMEIDDIRELVEQPYPLHFCPKEMKRYIKRLRAVCFAIEKIRK